MKLLRYLKFFVLRFDIHYACQLPPAWCDGGIITFDVSEMSNLSERLKEAGVEVGREKMGALYFPAIVQKKG